MAHSTEWCDHCEKWVTKGHSEKKHAKNYLSPKEESVQTFWHGQLDQ